MVPDTATESVVEGGEVMAAIDGSPERLIIADVSRDEAWLAMSLTETVAVPDYC